MNHPSQRGRREQAVGTLEQFFAQQAQGKSAATRDRYERVRLRLLEFLTEGDMSRCLDLRENARLADSRRRGEGFFGAFGLEEVLVCLTRFVDDDWLLEPLVDARAQVVLAGRLASSLQRFPQLDRSVLGCSVYETESAIRSARERLGPQRDPIPEPAERPPLRLIRGGRAEA